jgi:hypothetical protein
LDGLHYLFFFACLLLGWSAASALDDQRFFRDVSSRGRRWLLKIGVTLVLAEGFRVFLSFAVGPLLDMLAR